MTTRRMCTTAGRSILVRLPMGGNAGGAEFGTERRRFIWIQCARCSSSPASTRTSYPPSRFASIIFAVRDCHVSDTSTADHSYVLYTVHVAPSHILRVRVLVFVGCVLVSMQNSGENTMCLSTTEVGVS